MLTAQFPENIQEILAKSEILASQLNWSGAANLCKEAVDLAQENIAILDKYGWYLSRAKRYNEAIVIYEQLARLEPKMAKWSYMLGYQYYDQKMWKEAITCFDQALANHENYLAVLYRKGYALTQISQDDASRETFEKCINAWKNLNNQDKEKEKKFYSDASFQLGKIYLSLGQSKKAESIFAEALKYDSGDANKYYEYGKALLKNQKAKEALLQLQQAEKIEPRKTYIAAYIAQAFIELFRIEEADKALAKIPVEQRKEYIWRAIGKVRLAQKRHKEAIDALKRGLKLDPKNHNAYFQLGLAYVANNEYAQAYQAFSQAIDNRKNLYNLDFLEAREKLDEVENYAKINNISLTIDKSKPDASMGVVAKYNSAKGFGFIKRNNGEPDIFFHISNVDNPVEIQEGREVNFCIEDSPKGFRAKEITVIL
jgi:tetratricopeptide (TPR) repeat protein